MSRRSAIAKRVGVGLACLLVVTSSAGCVTEPTMALHAARVSHVDLSGVGIVVTVAVENDYAFDVLVREVQAEVVLADRFVLPRVIESPNVWLAAHEWTRIDVPVVVPWAQVTALLQTTASSTEIAYRMRGTANVAATRALEITVDRHPIDEQGVMSRAELLAMANRGMRAGGLSRTEDPLPLPSSILGAARALGAGGSDVDTACRLRSGLREGNTEWIAGRRSPRAPQFASSDRRRGEARREG